MKYIIMIMLLSSCVEAKTSCDGFLQNKYGENIYWRKIPVTFQITESVPVDMRIAIRNAATKWNKAAGRTLIDIEYDITMAGFGKNRVNTISFNSNWARKAEEQAYTQVNWIDTQIVESDILINSKHFKFYNHEPTGYVNKVSIEALMMHEFGHALGLTHTNNETSTMFPYLAVDHDRDRVDEMAIDSIDCRYK